MKRKISHTRLNPSLLFVSKGHGIKAHDIHWAHASRATINKKDEKDEKNFYHSVPKHVGEEKKKKKTPGGIYLFKVNKTNTRTMCKICSKLLYLW